MFTRQVESKKAALAEMQAWRLKGHYVNGPDQVTAPNGKQVWAYSASVLPKFKAGSF